MTRYPNPFRPQMMPRRGGYWPECLGVVIIAALVVLSAAATGILVAVHAIT